MLFGVIKNSEGLFSLFDEFLRGEVENRVGDASLTHPVPLVPTCPTRWVYKDVESLCTVPGLHRERAKGDAPTIRDRRRPNQGVSGIFFPDTDAETSRRSPDPPPPPRSPRKDMISIFWRQNSSIWCQKVKYGAKFKYHRQDSN